MTAKLFEAARAQREEDRVTQSQEKDEIAEKAKKAAAKAGFDTGQPSTSKAGKLFENKIRERNNIFFHGRNNSF